MRMWSALPSGWWPEVSGIDRADAGLTRRAILATAALAPAAAMSRPRARWPEGPLTVITPFPAHNTGEEILSTFSAGLGRRLGTTIATRAMPGEGGLTATTMVARSRAVDLLLMTTPGVIVVNPSLYRNLPYAPLRDLKPIARVASLAGVLMGRPDMAAVDVPSLISAAKALGRPARFGSVGPGTFQHLLMEVVAARVGLAVEHRPTVGPQESYAAIASGAIDLMIDGENHAVPAIREGRAKGYAVTTGRAIPSLPTLPPISRSGLTALGDIDVASWVGLFAPAVLPDPDVRRIAEGVVVELQATLVQSAIRERGLTADPSRSPSEFRRSLIAETAFWGDAVRQAGLPLR